MKTLRHFLSLITLVATLNAHAETKVLTYTAVIDEIRENTNTGMPPPDFLGMGTVLSGRWVIESGGPLTQIAVHATENTVNGVRTWSIGGAGIVMNGGLSLVTGPLDGAGSTIEWDYPGWRPVSMGVSFHGSVLNGLPAHAIPSLELLNMTAAANRIVGLTYGLGSEPWFTMSGHITAFDLETLPPPVPEPDTWLLMLGGGMVLAQLRRIRKSGSRSAGSK